MNDAGMGNGNGHCAGEAGAMPGSLTLYGSGHALWVHAGALQRLQEVGYLAKLRICPDPIKGEVDRIYAEVIERWNLVALRRIRPEENVRDLLTDPVRSRMRPGLWWRSSAGRACQPAECRAMCQMPPGGEPMCWSAQQPVRMSPQLLGLDDQRQEALRSRLQSLDHLPWLAVDYLIDWGYVLCDMALRNHGVGKKPEQRAFRSPSRLFYRSFNHHAAAGGGPEPVTRQQPVPQPGPGPVPNQDEAA